MNKLLDFAFVPLLLAVIFRGVLTYFAGVDFLEYTYRYDWEIWVYGACIFLAALCIWHYFFRFRCPECNAVDPWFAREREIDRFVGPKKVKGVDGKSRTVTHYVSTTYLKIQSEYRCSNCNHTWSSVGKRELT